MNLENLTIAQLRELQRNVEKQLKVRQQHDLDDARAKVLKIAQELGVPVKELIVEGNKIKSKSQPVAVKYRHPDDATLQWTGRGRQPKWVKEWTESGKSLAAVAI